MPLITRSAVLAVLTLCAGCDLFKDTGTVRGRVVDAITGEAVNPGTVNISITGSGGFSSFDPLLTSGEAAADGEFALSEFEGSPDRVYFDPTGRINYPGRDSVGIQAAYDGFRLAYFDRELPARSNLGTVGLYPTCTALGNVRLSRPLRSDELIHLRIASVPDVPLRFGSETVKYEGESLDSLRLLSVGGREARLEWAVRSGQEAEVASGMVSLPVCPRHDVLEYTATLNVR